MPRHQPWPTFPTLFEVASAHEEGGERTYLASTVEFVGENGELTGVKVAETEFVDGKRLPKAGTERIIPADLVLPVPGLHRRRSRPASPSRSAPTSTAAATWPATATT